MNKIKLNPHSAPCKDCEQRELHCHSTCEKWQEFETKKQAVYAERMQIVDEYDFRKAEKKQIISRWLKKNYKDRKDESNGHT